VNWKRTRSLDALDRAGKSSPFAPTPPRTDHGEITSVNALFSSTWQKSAQIIENRYFQVPVFCDTCALFGCKPRAFSALTKSTPIVYAPVLTEKNTADPSRHGGQAPSANTDSLGVTKWRAGEKRRRLILGNQPPCAATAMRDARRSRTDVDADVEAGVVPIGVMIAAPSAVVFHAVDVVVDLRTIVAVTRGVMVDAGLIVFEALVTRIAVVGFRAERGSDGQCQTAGQCGGEEYSA